MPLVKGYSTEMSIEVANLGVQVHGGMGFTWAFDCHLFYRRSNALALALLVALGLLLVLLVFGLTVDTNEFSMHHFYKNRLSDVRR